MQKNKKPINTKFPMNLPVMRKRLSSGILMIQQITSMCLRRLKFGQNCGNGIT